MDLLSWLGIGDSATPPPMIGGVPAVSSNGGMIGVDPASIRRAGLSRGLLSASAALMGGPSRYPVNFGSALGQGLGAFGEGQQQGQQFALAKQGAMQEEQGRQMSNELNKMTLDYYKGAQPGGLADPGATPVAAAGGAPDQPSPDGVAAGGPQPPVTVGDAAPGPVPGVRPAAVAAQASPGGSSGWRQQLYAMGRRMSQAPNAGLQAKGVELMQTALKAPDGYQFSPDFQRLAGIAGGPADPSVIGEQAYAKGAGEGAGGAPYKAIDMSRPGAAVGTLDAAGNFNLKAQAPIQQQYIDPATNRTMTRWVYPQVQTGGQGAPPAPAAAPSAGGGASAAPATGVTLYQPRPTNGLDNIYDIADAQAGLPAGSMRVIAGLETTGSKDTGQGSVSPNGKGVGRVQINPDTVAQGTNLADPFTNVATGAKRLAEYQQRYLKYVSPNAPEAAQWLGAAAYNWGPGNVDTWLKAGNKPDAIPQRVVDYANSYVAGIAQQGAGAAPGPQGQAPQPGAPDTGATVHELSPEEKTYGAGRGTDLAAYQQEVEKGAASAKNQNFLLDRLEQEGQNIDMGKGADILGNLREWALRFDPNNPALAGKVADYQSFRKNLIPLGSQAITQVSSRESQQGQAFIRSAFPSPETSPDGFHQIINQFRATNDYQTAKQPALQAWMQTHPTPDGFDAAWNKNADPTAFWVQRMTNDEWTKAAAKLQETDAGRAYLTRLIGSMQWLKAQGLGQ